MVKNPETIQECIEKARRKLHQIASAHAELWHPDVIRQSMILDELINEYNEMMYRKKASPSK